MTDKLEHTETYRELTLSDVHQKTIFIPAMWVGVSRARVNLTKPDQGVNE